MKKDTTKKTLVTLALACVTVAMTPFNAFADTGVTTARIFGSDRVGTAIAVADAGWTAANTAILAPSADGNLVDALAAAPLAAKISPILLTDNNTLTAATQAELVKLGVKNVYIVGAISQTVVDQVNAMSGVTASVLKGADRTDTAAAVASKLTNPAGSFVVGYGSLSDALSVASYAAANNYSILVANPDGTLPASETAYKGANTYIIGGPTLVEDIPGATRLFGADRFATNQAVLNALPYTYGHVYVANGTDAHLVDSLVASSLAAELGAPIVLTDPDGDGAIAATGINSKLNSTVVVTALGGNTVVTDSAVAQFSSGPTSGSTTVPVTGLTLNQPTLALMTGGVNGTLVATIAPSTATNQVVTWATSNAAVATVVHGVVTSVGAGTATITATTQDGGKLANSAVTVTALLAPSIVNLGTAGNYAILAKTGISSVPASVITGDIGVSPAAASYITGFSPKADATNEFATSTQVTGKIYAADYTSPTSNNLTTAVSDMATAYTDVAGRAANYTELGVGDISGKTLTSGVYKWGTGVSINTDVTLNGGVNDIFIFEIAGGITQANDTKIILTGGVEAKNIFWQSAKTVAIGTGSHFEGIILGMKNITLGTHASINGRLLAQTAVTLDQSTVVAP